MFIELVTEENTAYTFNVNKITRVSKGKDGKTRVWSGPEHFLVLDGKYYEQIINKLRLESYNGL